MIKESTHKGHKKRALSKKKIFSLLLAIIIIVFACALAIFLTKGYIDYKQSKTDSKYELSQRYKEGAGGNPKSVISYHDQAIKAWKSGDKQKARDFAQKGVDAAKELTAKQNLDIPNQATVILNLNAILDDRSPYDI